MRTIIVTGCLGFVGSNIVESLLLDSANYVIGIDTDTYVSNSNYACHSIRLFNKHKNFSFIEKSICDLDYLPPCDYIINCAASTHVDNSIFSQKDFVNNNILGVENLLQLIRNKHSFDRPILIHFSTDEVYGDENIPDNGFTEEHVLNPSNPYSASKASADQLIIGYGKTFEIPYIIVRPTNNYGIGQFPEKLITKNLKHLLDNKKVTLYGDGSNTRYWLHVRDTVEAVKCIIYNTGITRAIALNSKGILNISSDVQKTNKEVMYALINSVKLPIAGDGSPINPELHIEYVHQRKREDRVYKLNSHKFRTLYHWRPDSSNAFEENIREIVKFYIHEQPELIR